MEEKNIFNESQESYAEEMPEISTEFEGTDEKKPKNKYKFLAQRSQLRVWVKKEKYEKFRAAVKKNQTSVYRLINDFVDDYLEKNG